LSSFNYYLGTDAGGVHLFSSSYKGDAGQNITTQWVSKRLDFADQIPEALSRWKTIYGVELIYVDRGAVSVTVSISVDGGTNWTNSSATTVGTAGADKKVKSKMFYFIKTGKYFNFKITHTASSGIFQWIELRPEVEVGGEYFDIS